MACGTIAALGLTGGSLAANEMANSNIRGQMNKYVGQEMQRNKGFQQQGQNVFNQSLAQATPNSAQSQIGQGQQQLAGLINQAQSVPISSSMPSFGDANTQSQAAKQVMSNKQSSDLGGYSNYGLQQYLKNLNANSNLGLVNNQAQGWANVLPAQLQQAQQSQQGLQTLGSALGVAGMLTGLYGLSAAPSAAGGASGLVPAGVPAASWGAPTMSLAGGAAPSSLGFASDFISPASIYAAPATSWLGNFGNLTY